jgi:hypothetical protein
MAPRRDRLREDSALAAKRVRRYIRNASRPKCSTSFRRILGEYNFCRPVPAGAVAAGRRHDQDGMLQELRGEREAGEIRLCRAELNEPA